MWESNPRENVITTTYSAADGIFVRYFRCNALRAARKRHGLSKEIAKHHTDVSRPDLSQQLA